MQPAHVATDLRVRDWIIRCSNLADDLNGDFARASCRPVGLAAPLAGATTSSATAASATRTLLNACGATCCVAYFTTLKLTPQIRLIAIRRRSVGDRRERSDAWRSSARVMRE